MITIVNVLSTRRLSSIVPHVYLVVKVMYLKLRMPLVQIYLLAPYLSCFTGWMNYKVVPLNGVMWIINNYKPTTRNQKIAQSLES